MPYILLSLTLLLALLLASCSADNNNTITLDKAKATKSQSANAQNNHFAPTIKPPELLLEGVKKPNTTTAKANINNTISATTPKKKIRSAKYQPKQEQAPKTQSPIVKNTKKTIATTQENNAQNTQETSTPKDKKLEDGVKKIATIFFAHRDARLITPDKMLLDKLINYLQKHSNLKIIIQSHLDKTEIADLAPLQAEALLRKIGIARLLAIKKYFVNHNINDKRITLSQAGFSVKKGVNPADNRRIEIYIK